MLSGIGPAAALALFGIEVRRDLPVGEGLQDHCMTLINWKADHESLMTALTPENIELLQTEGRGPLSSNIAETGGFIRSRPGLEAPDCQFHCAPVLFHEEGLGAAVEHGIAFGPGVVKPTSRGSVTLRTASPYVKPRIQHNYLTTEEDRATILAGTKVALQIAQQDALKGLITGPFMAPDPESSDDELWTYIRGPDDDDLPPDLELRDRPGRGLAPEGPRRGRPARRRRVGDADDRARQHERCDDHDRREGRRPHQGRRDRRGRLRTRQESSAEHAVVAADARRAP